MIKEFLCDQGPRSKADAQVEVVKSRLKINPQWEQYRGSPESNLEGEIGQLKKNLYIVGGVQIHRLHKLGCLLLSI